MRYNTDQIADELGIAEADQADVRSATEKAAHAIFLAYHCNPVDSYRKRTPSVTAIRAVVESLNANPTKIVALVRKVRDAALERGIHFPKYPLFELTFIDGNVVVTRLDPEDDLQPTG